MFKWLSGLFKANHYTEMEKDKTHVNLMELEIAKARNTEHIAKGVESEEAYKCFAKEETAYERLVREEAVEERKRRGRERQKQMQLNRISQDMQVARGNIRRENKRKITVEDDSQRRHGVGILSLSALSPTNVHHTYTDTCSSSSSSASSYSSSSDSSSDSSSSSSCGGWD